MAGFFSQETKPVSEVKPVFTTEILEGTYRGLRDENDPVGLSGMCGSRPARGWFFFLLRPARCGFGGLVENGPAWVGNSGYQEPLQSLTGVCFVDSCFFNRTERYWLKWIETGLDDRTGAVVTQRKKGREEPPRDPRDADRIGTSSNLHHAVPTTFHSTVRTTPCLGMPNLHIELIRPTTST